MIKKIHRQNQAEWIIIWICIVAIIGLSILFLSLRGAFDKKEVYEHNGPHILMLLPSMEKAESEKFSTTARKISDQYGLRIETLNLSTVSAQQQMLSLVPMTDVDGVLLWAVSSIDEDYSQQLADCRTAEIPVVMIDHDFEDKTLRNSFIGSGINSELMVINQTLWSIKESKPIIIGCYSHVGSGDLYELLVMREEENSEFDSGQIWSERLKAFVENHPNDYYANQYIQVRTNASGTAALSMDLIETLLQIDNAGLIFSLNETLTGTIAMAIDSGALAGRVPDIFIGYGREADLEEYMDKGIIDELIVSDVLYSSAIGLRYLNDILRDLYVPETLDSGVKLIT